MTSSGASAGLSGAGAIDRDFTYPAPVPRFVAGAGQAVGQVLAPFAPGAFKRFGAFAVSCALVGARQRGWETAEPSRSFHAGYLSCGALPSGALRLEDASGS